MNEMEYLPLKFARTENDGLYDTIALCIPFAVSFAITGLAYFTGVWSF